MCARYRLTHSPSHIALHLGIALDSAAMAELRQRDHIFISQKVPIVRYDGGARRLQMAEWGFRATWDNSKRIFNAMAESADQKPTFRDAYGAGRCLLPADGFYEWPGKQMTLIHYPDNRLFCFAGLSKDNEVTLLTCASNEFMQPIHHRMPVILPPEEYDRWLAADTPKTELKAMTTSRPWQSMAASPIVSAAGNV